MLRFRNELFSVITVLAAVSLGACGDGIGVDTQATVRVLLTDAPMDYVGAAMVDIGVVELIPAGDGSPIMLSEDATDAPVNLLELQDGGERDPRRCGGRDGHLHAATTHRRVGERDAGG